MVNDCGMPWSLVLAAGEGHRLSSLTTQRGVTVPKQFCTLELGPSLLQKAVYRAGTVSPRDRICAVVAAAHSPWWRLQLAALPPENIISQPSNRGTAVGILLPLLYILERDADARVLLLPSDHHVADEALLAHSLQQAAARHAASKPEVILLGFEPRSPDPELGYIVPGPDDGSPYREVARFVEKPSLASARELTGRGALWNAFIIAADGRALLQLFERRCPEVVEALQRILVRSAAVADRTRALEHLYEDLAVLDFSKHVLQGQEQYLRVLRVPDCGWSDLGTPQRVAEVLATRPACAINAEEWRTTLSLAAQQRRLESAQRQTAAV